MDQPINRFICTLTKHVHCILYCDHYLQARNVSLQSRSPTTAAPKPTEPAAEEEATKEPVAA